MGTPPDDAATATAAPATSFVPVTLSSPSIPANTPTRPGTIEIVLDGGRTLRVSGDVDTVTLLRIVEALEARR
jgi:hypothetical protein